MEQIDFNLISTAKAKDLNSFLCGKPTENRIVLAISTQEKKTNSGLFIPGSVKDDVPKKGVIVAIGDFDDDHKFWRNTLAIGQVIQYGQYGGKEIFPTFQEKIDTEGLKFYVLSASEIIFIEPNIN